MDSKQQHGGNSQASLDRTPVQTEQELEASEARSRRRGEVPTQVAGYEILSCLGEGSFGTVWLARERKTGRQVAIKFFTHRRGLDWSLLTREVEKLAVLDASRDVVRLLDVGVDHDPPYFVMEYLPHRSVSNLLETGTIPVTHAIEITRSIARALVHAHGAGILHCDIKPGNVLLDRGNDARLGDFGQSRLASDQGASLGTFYYMAPEQARKTAIPDVRWDVYALGALLYHMLTGSPPYCTPESEQRLSESLNLEQRLETYREIIAESPVPSDHRAVTGVDTALSDLIDGCLRKDPARRIPNAQVILDALEKRELNRARRPLIWLGFLGPVLFLLTNLWIAGVAVPDTVKHAQENLFDQALISDMATVRLLAANLEQELADRQSELESLARLLPAPEDAPRDYFGFRRDVIDVLDQWRQETNRRLERQHRTRDESLFLTDFEGTQLYRDPWTDSIGRNFNYRDYFHGLGRELIPSAEGSKYVPPRQTSGVSKAFTSSNTGQFMVAIVVPVWSYDGTHVIGVLARTLHVADLLAQWEQRIRGSAGRSQSLGENERLLSLVDMREEPPLLLDHHWMTSEHLKQHSNDTELRKIIQLNPDEKLTLQRAARQQAGIADYHDPLADYDPSYDTKWLAAVASTNDIDWIAIVQERRDEAIAPMTRLYSRFLRYGLLMFVVFAVMLTVLWWLIQRLSASFKPAL